MCVIVERWVNVAGTPSFVKLPTLQTKSAIQVHKFSTQKYWLFLTSKKCWSKNTQTWLLDAYFNIMANSFFCVHNCSHVKKKLCEGHTKGTFSGAQKFVLTPQKRLTLRKFMFGMWNSWVPKNCLMCVPDWTFLYTIFYFLYLWFFCVAGSFLALWTVIMSYHTIRCFQNMIHDWLLIIFVAITNQKIRVKKMLIIYIY